MRRINVLFIAVVAVLLSAMPVFAQAPAAEADHNAGLKAIREARVAYNAKAEAFTKGLDEHNARVERHLDKLDARDLACKNKPYDEVDEIAIKKELAAGGK